MTADELDAVRADPIAQKYLKPFWQSRALLHGELRWCLWLEHAPPADLRASPVIAQRLKAVAAARLASKTAAVREGAAAPALFMQRRQPTTPYLAFPEVSSEHRRYIPAAFLPPEVIAGNKLIVWADADLWLFGVMQSAMFMVWIKAMAGRMKTDISIAPDLTYSTFPFPKPGAKRAAVEKAALGVLDARRAHLGATMAELYDPFAMPEDLLGAHRKLDRTIDSLYGRGTFDESKRLSTLLKRYGEMTSVPR